MKRFVLVLVSLAAAFGRFAPTIGVVLLVVLAVMNPPTARGQVPNLQSEVCDLLTGGAYTQCQNNLATCESCVDTTCQSLGFAYGKFVCGPNCTPDASGCTNSRFVDNGDGTITDNKTALMWEKKDERVSGQCSQHPNIACVQNSDCPNSGLGETCQLVENPHNVNNRYTWSYSGVTPDGTAFTDFLNLLNSCTSGDGSAVTPGFAGHCDWRLPQIDELATIIDKNAAGCGQSPFPPCVDPAFNTGCTAGCTVITCSCTESSFYWSATTDSRGTNFAWFADFFSGFVGDDFKDDFNYVRAVRGGSN